VIENEELLTFEAAAKRLAVSYASIWSWAQRGVDGRKLEVVVIGKRGMRTSIEACRRFTAYLAERRDARSRESAKRCAAKRIAHRGASA
jgi:hypothetical protein